ncbi:hypothetical protein ASC82_21600 [Streptomyces sp. Root431]|nr:hypothetical protein ASC82_21600 [Streptomyces sp. Root431]
MHVIGILGVVRIPLVVELRLYGTGQHSRAEGTQLILVSQIARKDESLVQRRSLATLGGDAGLDTE